MMPAASSSSSPLSNPCLDSVTRLSPNFVFGLKLASHSANSDRSVSLRFFGGSYEVLLPCFASRLTPFDQATRPDHEDYHKGISIFSVVVQSGSFNR